MYVSVSGELVNGMHAMDRACERCALLDVRWQAAFVRDLLAARLRCERAGNGSLSHPDGIAAHCAGLFILLHATCS